MINLIWVILVVSNMAMFLTTDSEGSYVVSMDVVSPDNHSVKVFSDDSIFVVGHYALEKTSVLINTTVDNNEATQKVKFGKLFLINLDQNFYTEYLSLGAPRNYDRHQLLEKKVGFDFIQKESIYNNESVKITKGFLGKVAIKKICFTSQSQGRLHGININLYLTKSFVKNKHFLINKVIETKFQGNLLRVEYDYGKQGVFAANYKFQKKVPSIYKRAIENWSK